MRETLNNSYQYKKEAQALKIAASGYLAIQEYVDIIVNSAKSNPVTLDFLKDDFLQIAKESIKNERINKHNKSLLDKAVLKLNNILDVEKIKADANSNAIEDIITRANIALSSGHIDVTIAELNKLPKDQNNFIKWIEDAKLYIEANQAASAIFYYVTSPTFENKDA